MAASIRKHSFLCLLMTSAIMLALCSTAWSESRERLTSYTTDTFMINIALDSAARDAAQDYLDKEINPTLEFHGQEALTSIGVGLVMIHSRANLRGNDGLPIGNGQDTVVNLVLVVNDPAAPYPPGISLLLVESFHSNPALLTYTIGKGLADPSREPSEVNSSQEIEFEEETDIKGRIEVSDDMGTIDFKTKFAVPEPFPTPPYPVTPGLVEEIRYRLRISYAPERLFAISQLQTVYEPPVSEDLLEFDIDVSPQSAGSIFNGQTDVVRLRFIKQIQVMEEILPD